jgi:hypothetical protein
MNCIKVRSLLGPWLDSELDARTTVEIEQHLQACSDCRRRLDAERQVEAGLAEILREERMPRAVWDRLQAATRPRPLLRLRWAWLAAAAAVIVAVVSMLPQPGARPEGLLGELVASHRATDAPLMLVSSEVDAVTGFLAGHGAPGWAPPASGVQAGHELRLLGASTEPLDGSSALQVRMTCCGRPVSIYLLDKSALDALPEAWQRDLHGGRVARQAVDDLIAITWIEGERLMTVLSPHDVPVEALRQA